MIYSSLNNIEERFDVVYADPPWDFNSNYRIGSKKRYGYRNLTNIKKQYVTMSKQELEALPVKNICNDKAVLLMWTTDAHLKQAIGLGEAWGFTYKTIQFIWHKKTSSGKTAKVMAPWGMKSCEIVLLFTTPGARSTLLKKYNECQLVEAERERSTARNPLKFYRG